MELFVRLKVKLVASPPNDLNMVLDCERQHEIGGVG